MARRGQLRVYLGSAPGVGKTYAMLDEGWRRKERGTDVVVGYVETHRRINTQAQVRDLEVVPRRAVTYRDSTFEELDVDAVLARQPTVALVDELAHTNVPGSRNAKRWEDVEELLAAGIDVVTTVNIQHLESLNDVIEKITGVQQRETVPDEVVRHAEQIELVDMSPEALRRRMAHGNIYPPERVDAALSNYFRPGNLSALRELALLWVADRVEENLQGYMDAHGIGDTWETRERVVVAVTGAPGGSQLARRAARIAGRMRGALVGVHVVQPDGLRTDAGPALVRQHRLVEALGGSYREIVGERVQEALVDFARSEKATQVVVGASRRGRWHDIVHGSVVNTIVREADGFDVHVIAQRAAEDGDAAAPPPSPTIADDARGIRRRRPPRRRIVAWLLVVGVLPLLTMILAAFRDQLSLATDLLLFLAVSVGAALLGGFTVGVVAAIVSSLLVNWFFTPPIHTWTIADPENLIAVVIFVAGAIGASVLVDRVTTRSREALRARAQAAALARTSAILIGEPDPVPELLEQLRATFSLTAVSVLSNRDDGWVVDASAGDDPPTEPFEGQQWPLTDDESSLLVVRAGKLSADDQRVLRTFLDNLELALQSRRLQAEAAAAAHLAQADQLRTALLQAVSHDLRTPLASIKASSSSLVQEEISWHPEERMEFARTIDSDVDRLTTLVENLLDMSRVQAGAVAPAVRPTYVDEVVAAAIASLGRRNGAQPEIVVSVPEDLPPVTVDPSLLERAVANVIANAVAWSPDCAPVQIDAARIGDAIHLRVVDKGPGVRPEDRALVFRPFQRSGDRSTQGGVGLGLAVARGFVEASGGEITLDDTPGGGLTVVIVISLVPAHAV